MLTLRYMLIVAMISAASGAAIPIWELLNRQEKLGRLMYVFLHLVDQYCTDSNIPDCDKVLTLYGLSNLVNAEDKSLDEMDPYHRNSRDLIWEKVMKGDFKLPNYKNFDPDSASSEMDYELANEVEDYPRVTRPLKATNDPHPYAVRVPAPPRYTTTSPRAATPKPATPKPIVTGSRYPHAVWVPAGIKPSADFEPMMVESRDQPAANIKPSADFEPVMSESRSQVQYTKPSADFEPVMSESRSQVQYTKPSADFEPVMSESRSQVQYTNPSSNFEPMMSESRVQPVHRIKPSADFEPMMSESRMQPVVHRVLPPRNHALPRTRPNTPDFSRY